MISLVGSGPILVLLIAAGATALPFFPSRFRPYTEAAVILVSAILLLMNARLGGPSMFNSAPTSTSNDLELLAQFNGPAIAFSLLLFSALLARLLIGNLHPETTIGPGALIALAGALVFLASSNWTTLAAGWFLLDLGLFAWRAKGGLASANALVSSLVLFGASQIGIIFFLAAGAFAVASGSALLFQTIALIGVAATLAIVASWIRIGLYPAHFSVSFEVRYAQVDRIRGFGLPMLVGFFLLARSLQAIRGEFAFPDLLFSIALIGLLATTILALRDTGTARDSLWSALALGSPVMLMPFVGQPQAQPAFTLWWSWGMFCAAVSASGASMLLAQTRKEPWVQILWSIALACSSGIPLTPMFLGRVGFYEAAMQSGRGLVILAVASSTGLALIPLWRSFFAARWSETRRPVPTEYMGIALLLLPVIMVGVAPFFLITLFGRSLEDASAFAYDALFHVKSFSDLILVLAAIILPVPLSYAIARRWDALRGRIASTTTILGNIFELDWLARVLGWFTNMIGVSLRQTMALIEQHPVGWLVFVAIWIALWILNTRVGR